MLVFFLFSFFFVCISKAIARALDEWELKKEAGELGTEQEQEEENIYAVTKEQEVKQTNSCMKKKSISIYHSKTYHS